MRSRGRRKIVAPPSFKAEAGEGSVRGSGRRTGGKAMTTDVYHRLARHLDDLPGGFPSTESGVELRILQRLFTPEDAELALALTLLTEEPRVIARRAGIPIEEAA